MNRIVLAAVCTLLAAAPLPAQPSSQAKTKASKVTDAATASHEDLNIRAYIELLRTDLKKSASQIMAEVMQLDADEATKFWPIYKEFQAEYTALGDQIVGLIKNYAEHYDSMNDTVADQLANQVLSIEQKRNGLKKKYYDRLKGALGAITAARFLQVENQLERLIDLQVAAQLPIVSGR